MSKSKDKIYDVVIIGGGVVGAILSKELTSSGYQVLLLEAGKGDAETYKGYQSYVETSYVYPNRPNSPYPQNNAAPSPGIPYPEKQEKNDPQAWIADPKNPKLNYWVQKGPVNFGSDYARALGGTTLHWLGVSMRHVPNDFHLKKKYGKKGSKLPMRNWPIDYKHMEPYYRRAEYELGVAADVREQSYLGIHFAKDYEYPMVSFPMTYFDYVLQQDIEGMTYRLGDEEYAINVVPVPQARNADPNPDARINSMVHPKGPRHWRKHNPGAQDPQYHPVGNPTPHGVGLGERCEGNSFCIPICPVQAKYNAMKTLNKADRKYLTQHNQCVASKVLCKGEGHPVTGIEYIKYGKTPGKGDKVHTARGKIYVLAAHAVENAKLCLMSGVANSSDQMGRNLMDHPYINFSGLYPRKIWGYRGPDVTGGIPLLRDGPFRREHASFRTDLGNWGWEFPKGSPVSTVNEMVETQGLYGTALRQALEEQGPRHMRIGYLLEQLPDPENRVKLSSLKDHLGLPRPEIHYDVDDYTLDGMDAAREFTEAIFQRVGITMQPQVQQASGVKVRDGKTYLFWGSGHLIGTHVMGDNPDTSCVDSYQQAHDHPNLFLAGCGSHPTSATANPTLTMAALAYRTLDRIQQRLEEE